MYNRRVAAAKNLTRALLDGALARGFGEAVAIREPKRVWSYGKLYEETARAAAAFERMGILPGERVAFIMHDSAELVAALLGAIRMGAVALPISSLLRSLEIREILTNAGAVAAVMSADLASLVEEVRGELPELKHLFAVGGALAGHVDFYALTRESDPTLGISYDPRPGDAAFLLYSANASRGVAHGHETPLVAFKNYARAVLALDENDRVFCTSRLSTAFGLGLGLLFPLMAGAATCLLPARPRPRAIFDVMLACRPTIFASTPSLYGQMVHDYRALPGSRPACFESVRHAVAGGEALPDELARRVRATFGKPLLHGFGATEALHFVMSNRPGDEREGTAGRALDGVEVRIVDDAGQPLGAQEIGVLELRAPTMARGYFGQEPWPEDGWVRTGDRFLVDNEGYFFHCGRTDDQFKVGGRWVTPDEVERTLLGHPSVWECAVVEGHDEDGLAQPAAYVVTNVGHQPTTDLAAQLMEFVKREIAPWKYPREIHFVESLPKDEGGRIQRWRLRRRPG